MSRLAQRAGATPANSRAADGDGDICPVCKSSRYLNPNMRFLMNPECYHKMCESCVDRIFSNGPAPCPVAGCRRTLRKHKFRKQTFEDIQVEREVDIRKMVRDKIGGRGEEDFESLRDFNNYLNDVEDITFNLVHKINEDDANRLLKEYEDVHRSQQQALKAALKARTGPASGRATPLMEFNAGPIKGLKKPVIEEAPLAYDPFGGQSDERQYFVLQERYDGDGLDGVKTDSRHGPGGYNFEEYYSRALCDAFSGLGVFIGEETPVVQEETTMVDVF